jgi:cytochrome c peroxidase
MKLPPLVGARLARYGLSPWLLGSIIVCIAIGAVSLHLWMPGASQAVEAAASQPMQSNEPIQPIEAPTDLDPKKIDLGRRLFDDPQLSHNNRVNAPTEGIQSDQVKSSIAEFERSLSTPDSRLDRYLRRDPNALAAGERQGYQLFKSFGCASCHQGVNVGGNMYQKLGIMAPYFTDRGHIDSADLGRFNVTGDPRDMYMFKVPGLRNVALAPPYFHDGSAATLADGVRIMAKYQFGRRLTDQEIELIVEFLNTLTGELNGRQL